MICTIVIMVDYNKSYGCIIYSCIYPNDSISNMYGYQLAGEIGKT